MCIRKHVHITYICIYMHVNIYVVCGGGEGEKRYPRCVRVCVCACVCARARAH